MPTSRREAILEGIAAAQRLHAKLGLRKSIESGAASHIDVFGIAIKQGAFLLFRPLKGLLGAYLGQPLFPSAGILISTQRDLHVQRFTAAHELGHMDMAHTPSLDENVGLWRGESSDLQEVAADAFASEFLLPRWLYVNRAAQHKWDSKALRRPDIVYQLSLRLGASYDATCWGLLGHQILPRTDVENLKKYAPQELKQEALAGRAQLKHGWADVWIITEGDKDRKFEGSPDDIIIFKCRERSSAGYLWDEARLAESGLEVIDDSRVHPDGEECGGDITRVLVTKVAESREYTVMFPERRPWSPHDELTRLSLVLDLQGKEQGLPRSARKTMAAA